SLIHAKIQPNVEKKITANTTLPPLTSNQTDSRFGWKLVYLLLTANVSVLTRRTCITIYATSNSPHCYTSHTINQNSSYFFESTISSKDAANAG
ncbi:TPA: hypothetical protein ACM25F_000936, partial [Neisseria meningitidis]